MNSSPARITVKWPADRRDFDDITAADCALVERRAPAVVTLDGHRLRVTAVDLELPAFSLLDVPYFREPAP